MEDKLNQVIDLVDQMNKLLPGIGKTLTERLCGVYGVSVPLVAGPPATGTALTPSTQYTIRVTTYEDKIRYIKRLREVTGNGLKETKQAVEAPLPHYLGRFDGDHERAKVRQDGFLDNFVTCEVIEIPEGITPMEIW